MDDFDEYPEIFGEAFAYFASVSHLQQEAMTGTKLTEKTMEDPVKAAKASRQRAGQMKSAKNSRDATLRKAGLI